ncbi:alpha/beta fold hydrolase [Arthrobacter sp. A5]|uniref:alpha/beta fold hydrolase n=1 Tax=Arthrobacter sp. A5 TaxID=576926 RepID=UPI003DAA05D2
MSHAAQLSRNLAVDDTRLVAYTLGSGPDTYILIHGIGMSSRYFRPLARELSQHATVHMFDLPGFGNAPKPRRPLSIEDYARIMWRCLDQLGVSNPILVGHSMGCQVAVEMARQRASAGAAVLMGPAVNQRERSAWQQGLRLMQDTFREPLAANLVVFSDYALRCRLPWYFANLPVMLSYALEEAIEDLTVPVLILRGGRDPIAPREWTAELAARCPVAETAEIASAGHILMYRRPAEAAVHLLSLRARV